MAGHILIVDDDPAVGTVLEVLVRQAGHHVVSVNGSEAALAALETQLFDVVLSDVRMPGLDGMGLLERILERQPELPVVLLTAHGTVPMAVEAMKRGAADFLLKPFRRDEILFVINKALTVAQRQSEAPQPPSARAMIGESEALRRTHDLIRRAAGGTSTVLIRGESGTGKELVARALHEASTRNAGPLVKVHCAALPESLLESELFGHERGAFTGAAHRKPGRVELAHGGTLFLDEIGDIPLAMQVKLLRVLQEREFERLGGRETIQVDVRFVAATHRDLQAMVARGQFREDLFYRLNVFPLWLPPLRERQGDVEILARHFCAAYRATGPRPGITFEPQALALLAAQSWPGNVRQLENFVARLVVLSDGPQISADEVRRELEPEQAVVHGQAPAPPLGAELPRQDPARQPDANGAAGDQLTLGAHRRQSERQALNAALERAGNNKTVAARILGVSRRTLYTKLEQYGLL